MTRTTKEDTHMAMTAAQPQLSTVPITFPVGLAGFEDHHRFLLVGLGPAYGPWLALRSAIEDGPTFVVAQPYELGIEMTVDIDDLHQALLGVTSPSQVVVFVIATLRSPHPTVNLRAPIVLNVEQLRAAQVPQEREDYPLEAPTTVPLYDTARMRPAIR